MRRFLTDPLLWTVPLTDAPRDVVQAWASSLDTWVAALEQSTFQWHHFGNCTKILRNSGRLADFETLRTLDRKYRLGIPYERLSRTLRSFLIEGSRSNEMPFRAEETTAEQSVVQVEPAEFTERNAAVIRAQLEQNLVCLAYDRQTNVEDAKSVAIATIGSGMNSKVLRVIASVDLVQVSGEIEPSASLSIDDSFDLFFSPEDLSSMLRKTDALVMTQDQRSEAILSLASTMVDGPSLLEFSFCSDFKSSLVKSSIHNNKIGMNGLIRRCAAVIAERDLDGLRREQFRETKSGNNRQIKRASDAAGGWRVTICKQGVGWRLNYWRIPSAKQGGHETIEFANVERKTPQARIFCLDE